MNSPRIANKKSWLGRAFPVPRSLSLSSLAVELTDGTLRFFEFAGSRGDIRPKSFGTLPFPRIHGDKGEKARPEAVAALKAWAAQKNARSVRVVIHEDEAYVFKVSVPTVNPREIRPAIEALLEENVPIPPADAVFEYEIIASDRALKETTVAVSVLSRESVREHVRLFSESGLKVVSLETEARALAKTLFDRSDENVHAVLSIHPSHSVVFIAERGAVVWSSSIAVGSRDLDRAVAKTLNVTEEEAAALRKKTMTETESDMKLFEAMIPVFSTIRDELSKVLVFWKSQEKKERAFKDVSDIVLMGSNSLIQGFSRYVSLTSKLPAKPGSVWRNVLKADVDPPEMPREESLDYGSLIGSLL